MITRAALGPIILVVDEADGVAGGIAGALAQAGREASTINAEALPRVRDEVEFRLDPDIFIIDGTRSDKRARTLCRRARHLTDSPLLVVVRDETDEATLVKLYEAGADHCAVRSTTSQTLLAKVRAILDGRLRRRESAMNAPLAGTPIAGRYRVVGKLGRGGMGVVFLVEHAWSGARRALKMLVVGDDGGDGNDGDVLRCRISERFEREVSALGSVDHPNIVAVHDAGKIGPTLYYVMDHLPGGSLRDRIDAEGAIGAITALGMVAKLGDAIQHLHDHGILHRDIKSENVLFDAVGEPVLTDFGLALDARKDRITREGFTVGTLRSMSPEQLSEPETVDARTDVYGLGILLFEALTGSAPFGDSSSSKGVFEVLQRILQQTAPSPKELDPSIPAHAAAVCRRALERDRWDRHQSAAELAKHCRLAIRGIQLTARHRRTTLSRPAAADPDALAAAS